MQSPLSSARTVTVTAVAAGPRNNWRNAAGEYHVPAKTLSPGAAGGSAHVAKPDWERRASGRGGCLGGNRPSAEPQLSAACRGGAEPLAVAEGRVAVLAPASSPRWLCPRRPAGGGAVCLQSASVTSESIAGRLRRRRRSCRRAAHVRTSRGDAGGGACGLLEPAASESFWFATAAAARAAGARRASCG